MQCLKTLCKGPLINMLLSFYGSRVLSFQTMGYSRFSCYLFMCFYFNVNVHKCDLSIRLWKGLSVLQHCLIFIYRFAFIYCSIIIIWLFHILHSEHLRVIILLIMVMFLFLLHANKYSNIFKADMKPITLNLHYHYISILFD